MKSTLDAAAVASSLGVSPSVSASASSADVVVVAASAVVSSSDVVVVVVAAAAVCVACDRGGFVSIAVFSSPAFAAAASLLMAGAELA